MPSWSEYKAIAKERGALAHELYVLVSTKTEGADIPSVLPEHLAYIRQQEVDGRLVFAGPLSDEAGAENSGDGLLILRGASLDEVRAIAEGDPMHTTGTRTFTIRKWLVNEGSLSLTIGLSGRTISLG